MKQSTIKKIWTFLFLTITVASLGQTAQTSRLSGKSIFSLQVGYPFPASGSTFNRIYNGVFDARLGYERIKKKLSFGGNIGYSHFQINRHVLDLNGTMTILSPGITAGYEVQVFKILFIHSILKCGYDFITFNGKDGNENSRPSFQDGGASFLPIVSLEYYLNRNLGIGISGSYEVIFQRFGNNAVKEESTTTIIDCGLKLIYKL